MWALGFLWVLLAAPSEADVERALARARSGDRYQTEMPVERAPDAPPPTREAAPAGRTRTRSRDRTPSDPTDMRPVGKVLLILLACALGAALAVWAAREVRERWHARSAIAVAETPGPATAAAAPPRLADHEALARAGQFAEAVHSILVLALAAIGRAGSGLPVAWTSREILAAATLPDGRREALASLVRLVELTRFGGVPATEGDYRRALACLAGIVAGRAAA
jgi:hypothetical protein